ncbi:MAG TPA: cache domain-containing protein, partial [Syntrophales bacterium]|nr:cache domain-containing protein [Syntrophales bacterium]
MFNGFVKKNRGLRITVSIWMAALSLVCLILVLAVTIHHKIEKDMIRQYGQQQQSIAREKAERIEELLWGIERRLFLLSRLPTIKRMQPDETLKSLMVVFDDLEGKVRFIARLDEKGEVLSVHPAGLIEGSFGRSLQYRYYLDEIERTGKPYVSDLILLNPSGENGQKEMIKSILVAVPKYNDHFRFSGVILAALSLSTLTAEYFKAGENYVSHDTWLIDQNGTILIHPRAGHVGKDVSVLEKGKVPSALSLKERMLQGKASWGEFLLPDGKGSEEKYVVAYTPVHFNRGVWYLAVSVPYNSIVSVVRRTFVNTMMGTVGLIVVILSVAFYIVYESRKKFKLKEELKRITERSEWQEMLIREKKTIEGIIEGFPIPAFVINKEHRVILWNRACKELTGYDAKDIVGTKLHYLALYSEERPLIADLIIDQDFEGMERYYGAKLRKSEKIEGAYEVQHFFENLGGKPKHVYFLAAPIYDEKGEIIEAIETLQDISKEVTMSRRIKEYANNLQMELDENIRLREEVESLYAYLQSIIDSSPDRLFELDPDGMVSYVSGDLKRGAHLISPQFKGKHFTEFVAPEHRDIVEFKRQQL